MNYGVDPHTSLLIVGITLPGMFLLFVIVGTWVYLARRRRHKKYLEHRKLEDGDQPAGAYEKWLEQIVEPGASQSPSQNPSAQNIPMGRIGLRIQETGSYEVKDGSSTRPKSGHTTDDKSKMAAVEERAV